MSRSIRARLLLWYMGVLVFVMGASGALLRERMWTLLLARVDEGLSFHLRELREDYADEPERFVMAGSAPATGSWAPEGTAKGEEVPYAAVWNAEGGYIFLTSLRVQGWAPLGRGARTRGELREVFAPLPGGGVALIGRSLAAERREMDAFLRILMGVGGAALGLAFLGGWLLVGRVLAPIARMTRTASTLSATSLSARIDVEKTESELGELARTLNGAFDRLEAAFARQTRFTADASHELRTPLSVLLAQIELALKRDRTAAEYRETLDTCLSAARRMKGVVEGLLTLARADAGEARLERERCDLGPVAEETVRMLEPAARAKGISLRASAASAEVLGDRNLLREMATNLVSNAITYNRPEGTVDISVRAEGSDAVLEIRDTGIGIPAADAPHLFERFYRVDKARSREAGGSGLGLSITKWIVELHGGRIGFASDEGKGTVFTVRLPRADG